METPRPTSTVRLCWVAIMKVLDHLDAITTVLKEEMGMLIGAYCRDLQISPRSSPYGHFEFPEGEGEYAKMMFITFGGDSMPAGYRPASSNYRAHTNLTASGKQWP